MSTIPNELQQKKATLLIIGGGRLGTAVLQGLLSNPDTAGLLSRIVVAVRSEGTQNRLQRLLRSSLSSRCVDDSQVRTSVILSDSTPAAIEHADIIFLACGHNDCEQSLARQSIKDAFRRRLGKQTIVSFMGGVTIDTLRHILFTEKGQPPLQTETACCILRALPNVAAKFNQSITAVARVSESSAAERSKDIHESRTETILRLFGTVIWTAEQDINAAGALCASSLAYYATIIEAVAEGGRGQNSAISRETALQLSAQAAKGAARLIEAGETPEQIRAAIVSPGGSTARGIQAMKDRQIAPLLREAIFETSGAADDLSTNAVRSSSETSH
ncbi:delta 1-pyrroline-5-carboxylate reductase [Exophiala dermatitidis]|uniref:Pyrroline-5-carboxylate reductase n=2 Tax=Exophiala dermatitidis TaxID=5970 RepID=H6BYM0_EXODN|nr:pyrroline-5-carboxylate reductase [Exophiala dermatitidis NIH/UT8656]KAJ4520214.1 delta 1-pyrroline-5-carboxylate reductase [Exophiala dermatitidis]EHY56733.1 pyrroline-5-carboxylate reductase [Exophiala dermatitidis NIH/UT8656]KAJ4524068.1 delta 1-pyrroline-5-carboxylate reductase [Exophiala dermatitidis]KAJ4525660.1 delta 1-pyrroline-5-carboxylate reductase [Exophiala dermatitidis]KAJ4536980.1 delta 1-pyrroline-5-carboxylate reductase [Exophiala dermatitidis]